MPPEGSPGVTVNITHPGVSGFSSGVPVLLCAHRGALQPPLRLEAHSPLPPASGPLLPGQGPQLLLRGVLVAEETEGTDRQVSGTLRHGGRAPCQGSETPNSVLKSEGGMGPRAPGDRRSSARGRPGEGSGGGLGSAAGVQTPQNLLALSWRRCAHCPEGAVPTGLRRGP